MAARVTEFLTRYAGRPMAWGKDDCSMLLADWWTENHGTDPAAALRETYATEAEKAMVVKRAGGLPRLVASIAASVGARRTQAPRDGDFGVIQYEGSIVAGIRVGLFWAVRSSGGIAFVRDAKVVRAWEI